MGPPSEPTHRPKPTPSTFEAVPDRYKFATDPVANPDSVIKGSNPKGNGHYRFTVLTERAIRFEWSPDGAFEDRASTLALFRKFKTPVSAYTLRIGAEVVVETCFMTLIYNTEAEQLSPASLRICTGQRTWHFDGQNYGDLGGTARTLDGVDGRMPLTPGIASRHRPYSVVNDSESMLFEQNGWIGTRKPGRIDAYFFACDHDYPAAIRDFYSISGKPPLLPRWALGNWWSRFHEYTAKEYLDLVDRFRRKGIPLSVAVIDMDWHLVKIPKEYGSGWTGYTWNKQLFPDPRAFLAELHERGLKVAINDHPAEGVRSFEDLYKDVAEALHRDPSAGEAIEFDCCDPKFMDAYFDVLKARLEEQGVDFWWIDWQQGETSKLPGVDPLWVLNHYHFLASKRNVKTIQMPMTFSRYAGPGSHRYPIGFSGDTVISWESLQFQPEFTATASNIGYGWWSHDIGGHWGGIHSDELTARWVQLGCFSPIMRLHSTKSYWISKEPWDLGTEASHVTTQYLRYRHRLIPYLYTMNVRAAQNGEPLVQPLYWKHPPGPDDDDVCFRYPNQFYFGPDMLVAPITQPRSPISLHGSVPVWLPRRDTRYIDLIDPFLVYAGGRELVLHRGLDRIPVLAPQGTVSVLGGDACFESHGTTKPNHIYISIVVGDSGSFELIEEPSDLAGDSEHVDFDAFVRTPISWKQTEGVLTIGPAKRFQETDVSRVWTLKLVGHTSSDLSELLARTYGEGVQVRPSINPGDCTTRICLGDRPSAVLAEGGAYVIHLGGNRQLNVVDMAEEMEVRLFHAKMPIQLKEDIMAVIQDVAVPVGERVKRLRGMKDVDEAVKDALMEVWLSDDRSELSAIGHENGEASAVDDDGLDGEWMESLVEDGSDMSSYGEVEIDGPGTDECRFDSEDEDSGFFENVTDEGDQEGDLLFSSPRYDRARPDSDFNFLGQSPGPRVPT